MLLFAVAALLAVGSPVPAAPAEVRGFADYHLHQMAGLAFGGKYIWGGHDGDQKQALRHCSGNGFDHGLLTGSEGGSGNLKPHGKDGFPQFNSWPRWNATSHQQVHADWLKAAHDQGMRLAVVSALNQDLFCEMIPSFLRDPKVSCDDFQSVVRQLQAAHEFAKHHDWYVIVTTPQEARAAIGKGKLAVVLAVEAGNALGEGKDWLARLDKLHALGVRSFQPVHEIDNRFSGAAWHAAPLKALEAVNNLEHLEQNVDSWVKQAVSIFDKNLSHPDRIPAQEAAALKRHASAMFGFTVDKHNLNVKGLSAEGQRLVAELMRRQMLVDVSHMSQRAVHDTWNLSRVHGSYPLFVSHAHIKELLTPADVNEWTYPAALYDLVAETGGVVGLRSSPDQMHTVRGAKVANDCDGSSKSFAQKLYFAEELLGLQVGFATDFNGFAQNLMPRFGARGEGCAASPSDPEALFQSLHQKDRTGSALDAKGFAHIGLIGHVLGELKHLGANTRGLERSAETFLQMWERALDPHRPHLLHTAHAATALTHLEPLRGAAALQAKATGK